jgi:hypothetical protein
MKKNYNLCKDNSMLAFGNLFKSRLRGLAFLLIIALFSVTSNAQVTTNSGSGLDATYSSLALAIDALNLATITSPVSITLTGNETAPVGGFTITASGTAVNNIVIKAVSSTITANSALTAGVLTDAIFKIIGGDYITIDGFTMLENPANTTIVAGSNNMTEFGVALFYATTTNGCQNITIKNNTIDLNRTYLNTWGIYSNSNHSAIAPLTSVPALSVAGNNSGLTIIANTITDVNNGILVLGPSPANIEHDGLVIGGSLANANTITNFGTATGFSSYANVSGTINGILLRFIKNYDISYNTITSTATGPTLGTMRGICHAAGTSALVGTIVNTISNNTISVKSALAAGVILGIAVETTAANATTTLNINNNSFNALSHTVDGTGSITVISNTAPALNTSISNNKFNNLSVNTTASFTFITNSITMPVTGFQTVSGNEVVTGFSKTGVGNTVILFTTTASSPTNTTSINTNNKFSNITVSGATAIAGWINRDGANTTSGPIKTITNNTFTNWSGGTLAYTVLTENAGASNSIVSNNIINNIIGANLVTGISVLNNSNATFQNNIINTLATTGITGITAVASGITLSGSASSSNSPKLYKNKIYDLSASDATGTVNGIFVAFTGTTTATSDVAIANNIIGDLRAPNASNADAIRGISITATVTAPGTSKMNIFHNTVALDATSTGTDFGTSGVFHTYNATATSATLDMRNNIIVNNSTPKGTGKTVAFRRSIATDLNNYAAASNNNLFYAGTPGANNLLFSDGTNFDQTLGAFQSRVASRETASISLNPKFTSTTGTNPAFLHIDSLIPTAIDGAGQAIESVTTDFDGETRNASTPDIGADEFTLNGTSWLNNNTISFWTNGAPTNSIDATIAANYSVAANISAKSLTVNNNAIVTIPSGNNVTVADAVNVSAPATFTLSNNANLIQVNAVSNTGNIVVYRNSNDLFRSDYTLWSSPVASQNLKAFSPATTLTRFYNYDNTQGVNGAYSEIASPSTTNFTSGSGYLIRMPNTDSTINYDAGTATLAFQGIFAGVPNNGDVTLSGLASDKYYAVGNPYPSTISANDFINGNSTGGTLYFWRKKNGGLGTAYATYNLVGSTVTAGASGNGSETPNGSIQVGQGFIVKTGVLATTLNFTNAMRETAPTSTQFFKTKKGIQQDRIWLNLTTATGVFSQALIGYMDGATIGVDNGIDGVYINDSPIALTSNINGLQYTIQGRPSFDPTDVVSLYFNTDLAGDYTIAIDHLDGLFSAGQDIYLVDSKTGTETNLKSASYTFAATSGADNSRFSLKYQKTLKVDTSTFNDASVIVYRANGTLFLNSVTNTINNIQVFDIQGRLIAEQKDVNANTASIKNLKAANQVLVVKVTSEDNKVVSKKVVN